jgi:ADP-specific Phosphofructokinase/Glucokinase conserved region
MAKEGTVGLQPPKPNEESSPPDESGRPRDLGAWALVDYAPQLTWRERYRAAAEFVSAESPKARPLLLSSTACVDRIYHLDSSRLAAIGREASVGLEPARTLCAEIMARVTKGNGGELYCNWPEGSTWATAMFGPAGRSQVGGTGPQAAWSLDVLGAPTVLGLADRSSEQMAVISKGVGLCTAEGIKPASDVQPIGHSGKTPNHILEFAQGTLWSGGTLPRSSRIILRFRQTSMELDECFIKQQPRLVRSAGGGLLAGVNELAANDTASRRWIKTLARTWTDLGMASIHLELGDYEGREALVGHLGLVHGVIDSIGMSLSELRGLFGSTGDPASLALQVAETVSCRSVYVHADGWSFAVHRDSPREILARLLVGNLLAASRAAHGSPSNRLEPDASTLFAEDCPASGNLRDGWRLDCVPSPYLRKPRSTVGLGDTFAAGLLLGGGLPSGKELPF